MAFGILEPADGGPPPTGTSLLSEIDTSSHNEKGELVLVPKPSSSPKDPLNFSRWRKEVLFFVLMFGTGSTAAIGPLVVPGFGVLAKHFKHPISKIALFNSCLILTLGVSAYLCSFASVVYGRRLIYLFTIIIVIVTSCWGGAAKSYNSLLAARIVQGLGMGGFFALTGSASINDVFFVHQRATRVGLWNAVIVGATNLTPIVSGYVIVDLSWRWCFYFLAITFGVLLLLTIFFLPETKFEHDTTTPRTSSALTDEKLGNSLPDTSEEDNSTHGDLRSQTPSTPTTGWRHFLGAPKVQPRDHLQVLRLTLTPFILLLHPAVLWTSMMWAVVFGWGIITGLVANQIFSAPPYNLSPSSVGNLVGIAPLIGSTLAAPLAGRICDYLATVLAKRNKGVYEPEFRLWILVVHLVAVVIGAFGLGLAIHNELSPVKCGVFLAILNFAIGTGATGVVSYSNDVCQQRAGEALGIAMLIKSVYIFGITWMLNDYYTNHGPVVFFGTWGGINVGLTLLAIPMYVFGKRIRSWAAKHGIA